MRAERLLLSAEVEDDWMAESQCAASVHLWASPRCVDVVLQPLKEREKSHDAFFEPLCCVIRSSSRCLRRFQIEARIRPMERGVGKHMVQFPNPFFPGP